MAVKDETRRKTPLLIVDDDKAVRRLLARVAERAGFEVDTAKDGFQALEMLQHKQYEIAIVDLMMPRLSGYELVQKISTLNPRPVVIVATALMNGDVASLDDSMVRRVIKKPFDINAVANALVEIAREAAEKRAATPPEEPTIIVAKDVSVTANEVIVPTADGNPEQPKMEANATESELPKGEKIE
jgi:DNA-binding response OmpR family regulator